MRWLIEEESENFVLVQFFNFFVFCCVYWKSVAKCHRPISQFVRFFLFIQFKVRMWNIHLIELVTDVIRCCFFFFAHFWHFTGILIINSRITLVNSIRSFFSALATVALFSGFFLHNSDCSLDILIWSFAPCAHHVPVNKVYTP